MTPVPYFDPGSELEATRSGLIGHHLRETLAAPLIKAAMEQQRGHPYDRMAKVTAIVENLVAHCDPYLLAEMLVVEHWDTAMVHARHLVKWEDQQFAGITAALIESREGRHRAGEQR